MRSESRSKGLRNGSANESVSCVSLQLKPTEMAGLSALVCLSPQHPCRERGGGDLRISRKLMDSSLGVCACRAEETLGDTLPQCGGRWRVES